MGVQIDGDEMRERAGLPAAKSDKSALKAPGQATSANSPQEAPGARAPTIPGEKAPTGLLAPLKTTTGANPGDTPTLQSQQAGSGSQREPDPIALTTEEALGDWEALVTPMLDPVDFLMGDCSDLGELQSRLSETIEKMGTDAFTEALAKGLFAARVSGEATQRGAA
jgi:hypothetical protein